MVTSRADGQDLQICRTAVRTANVERCVGLGRKPVLLEWGRFGGGGPKNCGGGQCIGTSRLQESRPGRGPGGTSNGRQRAPKMGRSASKAAQRQANGPQPACLYPPMPIPGRGVNGPQIGCLLGPDLLPCRPHSGALRAAREGRQHVESGYITGFATGRNGVREGQNRAYSVCHYIHQRQHRECREYPSSMT